MAQKIVYSKERIVSAIRFLFSKFDNRIIVLPLLGGGF